MQIKTTIEKYMSAIQRHHYDDVLSCFSENALVQHPILGEKSAKDFFKSLLTQTTADKAVIKNIFYAIDHPQTGAVYFRDEWKTKDNTAFSNDIVLIFECDEHFLIKKLIVIFDTYLARSKFA